MSRRERLLLSVQELDRKIEGRLHSDCLIGVVVAVKTSQSEQTIVRPRPVTFGWQRGIKIGECVACSVSNTDQFVSWFKIQ